MHLRDKIRGNFRLFLNSFIVLIRNLDSQNIGWGLKETTKNPLTRIIQSYYSFPRKHRVIANGKNSEVNIRSWRAEQRLRFTNGVFMLLILWWNYCLLLIFYEPFVFVLFLMWAKHPQYVKCSRDFIGITIIWRDVFIQCIHLNRIIAFEKWD